MQAATNPILRKRLPAYGRELMETRRRGLVPERGFCNVHVIVVLDNWKLANGRFRLVVAADDDPALLDFTGVAGLDVLLGVDSSKTDLQRRNATAHAILGGLPASLIELDIRAPHAARFIKTHAMGIELEMFR